MAIDNKNKGFTIFFAVLAGGLALAIGVAIYDLTVRELNLSATATQSQYSIYAADTGVECALYWDYKCTLSTCAIEAANPLKGSAFATSTSNKTNGDGTPFPPTSGILCNSVDVAAAAVTAGTWPAAGATTEAATTMFTITFDAQPYCAKVEVIKIGTDTTVISRGYNTCAANAPLRLERALRITY